MQRKSWRTTCPEGCCCPQGRSGSQKPLDARFPFHVETQPGFPGWKAAIPDWLHPRSSRDPRGLELGSGCQHFAACSGSMRAARYLRGMRCQGKAGPVPRSRGGICSRSLWKRTKSRWCFASCSLLRGGGGCHQPEPRSWATAGAWLRLGKARCMSWRWQGAGRDPAGIRRGGWERWDLELSHSQP